MSEYKKFKHDIGFLRQAPLGTTTVGLRLAKDKNGNPIYGTKDDDYLASQMFTGTPGYGNLPPEKELAIRQDDWRSGFGQEVYDANDPKRYYSSIGMDGRYRGMFVAGPVATGINIDLPEYEGTNLSFEDWGGGNPDDWTKGGNGTIVEETSEVHDGSSSIKITAGAGESGYYYQDFTKVDQWIGRDVIVSCWVKPDQSDANLGGGVELWRNGVKVKDEEVNTTTSWTQSTPTAYTVPAATTALQIRVAWRNNVAAERILHLDLAALSTTTPLAFSDFDHPAVFAEFNDLLYVGCGVALCCLNAAGTGLDIVKRFGAAITDLTPFTDDKLYICLGTSDAYWEMTTSEAFTENGLTVKTYQFFERVDAASPTMWGNNGGNTIYKNTDPSAGGASQWTGPITVDSSYHSITALLSKSGALYIMKEDMPYYLNSSDAVQNDLAADLKSDTCSTSGKNAFLWKHKLYIPFGVQGLLETDGTTNAFLNPAAYCTNLSDFVGRVMAVAGDGEYLFVAVDNGTENEILAGREETIDGTTGWVWHPIQETTLTPTSSGVETIFVSSVFQKRLWVASTNSGDDLYYIKLPTGYGDLEADANRSFQANSYMITPWLHGNFKADDKAFIKIDALLGHAHDLLIYFECWYQVLGDTTWTDAGDLIGTATNRTATLYIPEDSGTNEPSSEMIRFKFVAKTDDVQRTPILLGYDCRAILYPTNRRIIECEVLCDDEITQKDGLIEKGQAATIKTALEEARNATWPVTFYPLDWESSSDTIYVKFLPLQTAVTKKEKGRGTERHYLLRLQEIALS